MKKRIYRARTKDISESVFEVVSECKKVARQKIIQDCRMVMGESIHSSFPDDEINKK